MVLVMYILIFMIWEEYFEEIGDIVEYDIESFCYELLVGE